MSSKEWMVVGLGEVGVMQKGEGELGIVCKILKILNKRKKRKHHGVQCNLKVGVER